MLNLEQVKKMDKALTELNECWSKVCGDLDDNALVEMNDYMDSLTRAVSTGYKELALRMADEFIKANKREVHVDSHEDLIQELSNIMQEIYDDFADTHHSVPYINSFVMHAREKTESNLTYEMWCEVGELCETDYKQRHNLK